MQPAVTAGWCTRGRQYDAIRLWYSSMIRLDGDAWTGVHSTPGRRAADLNTSASVGVLCSKVAATGVDGHSRKQFNTNNRTGTRWTNCASGQQTACLECLAIAVQETEPMQIRWMPWQCYDDAPYCPMCCCQFCSGPLSTSSRLGSVKNQSARFLQEVCHHQLVFPVL